MVDLHYLESTGVPFHTEDVQLKFNDTASESLPALRKLEYCSLQLEYGTKAHRPDPETYVLVLQIRRLQEITWIGPDVLLHPSPILVPIHASRKTLTRIRIPVPISYITTYEPLTQFFILHFSCLSTLHLGGTPRPPSAPRLLTS